MHGSMTTVRLEPVTGVDGSPVGTRALLDGARRRNALGLETVSALLRALEEHPHRTVLLGSTASDIFCAGVDLTCDEAGRAGISDLLYACYESMVTRPGVVIAVVEGAAVGGGAQLTTAADLRVASSSARWRWVGPGHGLAVGAWILPDLVGRGRALDLMLTGRWLPVDEAHATGLVAHRSTEAWAAAENLARGIAQLDAGAVARLKTISARPGLVDGLREERAGNARAWDGRAVRTLDPGSGDGI
jgi:enoyl-CoA hydratase/carnithine racemase